MKNESKQLSDILPLDEHLFGGEISMAGDFTFDCTFSARKGDLLHTGLEMKSDFGNASCTMLGKRHYFAVSEAYRYKQGLYVETQLNQPMVELHFQMEGEAQAIESSRAAIDLKLDLRPGQVNMMIIPPLSDFFELKEEMGGAIFGIIFSQEYLLDLSNRFPDVMEPVFTKMKEGDLCFLSEKNIPITPRMRSVIQRIQNLENEYITGSLFLEAQILELLYLFFNQVKQSASHNGSPLSRIDQERIHRAREILTERLEYPPTLAELVKLVGTNEFKLKQGFRALFDTTPYAFHLKYKLELARSYILDTNLTIAEIAYKVGYSDPAHLTNAFRKQFGIPPSGLRS